jgi:GGDEF domain-containing protein
MLTNGVGFLLIMYDRSYALVKESSNLDPLTRIYNRRFFMNKAESYFKRHSKKMVTYHFFLLILIFSRK